MAIKGGETHSITVSSWNPQVQRQGVFESQLLGDKRQRWATVFIPCLFGFQKHQASGLETGGWPGWMFYLIQQCWDDILMTCRGLFYCRGYLRVNDIHRMRGVLYLQNRRLRCRPNVQFPE